jgi:hypothetical protein
VQFVTEPLPDTGDTTTTWVYDVALDELRELIVPNIVDEFASRGRRAWLVSSSTSAKSTGSVPRPRHAELAD